MSMSAPILGAPYAPKILTCRESLGAARAKIAILAPTFDPIFAPPKGSQLQGLLLSGARIQRPLGAEMRVCAVHRPPVTPKGAEGRDSTLPAGTALAARRGTAKDRHSRPILVLSSHP
jgi:hypothetical protein